MKKIIFALSLFRKERFDIEYQHYANSVLCQFVLKIQIFLIGFKALL
jgi:hypothetical protein